MKSYRYNLWHSLLMFVTALLLMQSISKAQTQPQGKGYDAFKGMKTRNIFDPDRRGPRIETAPAAAASKGPDFVALTGTMVTSNKTLAFFAGSRSEFNKVLSSREKIADYTVTNITSTHVELEKEGKPLTLGVGRQISMDGSGTISASSGTITSGASSTTSTEGSALTPPSGVPADKAEVLRRMMERRQKEVSK